MRVLAQQLLFGLMIGGLYGLAAAGLSLVFGVMKVLNVAHGELIMLGGYAAFWLVALLHIDPFASLLVVIPLSLLLGVALYWGLFGFVVRADEETRVKNSLLIGFGLALAFQALAVRLWTADERSIPTPYGGAVITVAGLSIPLLRLITVALAFALIGGLHLLLEHWRWGKAIRATAEDWQAALLSGIDAEADLWRSRWHALAAPRHVVTIGYSVSRQSARMDAQGVTWSCSGLGPCSAPSWARLVLGVGGGKAARRGPTARSSARVSWWLVSVARPLRPMTRLRAAESARRTTRHRAAAWRCCRWRAARRRAELRLLGCCRSRSTVVDVVGGEPQVNIGNAEFFGPARCSRGDVDGRGAVVVAMLAGALLATAFA